MVESRATPAQEVILNVADLHNPSGALKAMDGVNLEL
ncbi:hypothetical protein OURE66S_01168 [Oligella ureolytica]